MFPPVFESNIKCKPFFLLEDSLKGNTLGLSKETSSPSPPLDDTPEVPESDFMGKV